MSFFVGFPPEVNAERIYGGVGPAPLRIAAMTWFGLAAEMRTALDHLEAQIVVMLAEWSGQASVEMNAVAEAYRSWLSAVALQAELTAEHAQFMAMLFDAARAATVPPTVVLANRQLLRLLLMTNWLGQNFPTIAAVEFDYMEMWLQNSAAMQGYAFGADEALATMAPFPVPLPAMQTTVTQALSTLQATATQTEAAAGSGLTAKAAAAVGYGYSGLKKIGSIGQALVNSQFGSLLQNGLTNLESPLVSALTSHAGAAAAGPQLASDVAPLSGSGADMSHLGGTGASAGVGQGRLVGNLSVPQTWPGSMPPRMANSVIPEMTGRGISPGEVADNGSRGMQPMPMAMPMRPGGAGPGGRVGGPPQGGAPRPRVVPVPRFG